MQNKFLHTVFSVLLLAGCATNEIIGASYSSEVDPDFSFAPTKTIAVLVSEQGNTLETKYYVDQIVTALRARGFENVYSYRDVKQARQPFEIGIIVNVSKSTDSYQYDDANLGLVDSGQ